MTEVKALRVLRDGGWTLFAAGTYSGAAGNKNAITIDNNLVFLGFR